jgi:hypothetical protein
MAIITFVEIGRTVPVYGIHQGIESEITAIRTSRIQKSAVCFAGETAESGAAPLSRFFWRRYRYKQSRLQPMPTNTKVSPTASLSPTGLWKTPRRSSANPRYAKIICDGAGFTRVV